MLARIEAGAAGIRDRGRRTGGAPLRRDAQPEDRHRRGRGGGAQPHRAERGADAAVPDRRGRRRSPRRSVSATVTWTCAGRGCARTSACGTASPWRSATAWMPTGFWEIETPLLTKSTPEGGPRLPGAQPAARGRVLRAAAVAADLQADPDDLGHGPLLPDREVLPRRGPARGPAAGVHADRRRDVRSSIRRPSSPRWSG